jgi:hypothetical protein
MLRQRHPVPHRIVACVGTMFCVLDEIAKQVALHSGRIVAEA